ncbi:MAG: DNA polymerase III subunit gamma/tau [Anaerolineales bacterium]|nr:DNA polymerase III subunit gamma/tau [Anaerolineales bacterium]
MAQVLYRKWRPMTFEEVVGQDHVTQTLLNAIALGRIGHAYLFFGPRGTGKTSTARLLAKAVNCLDDDLDARPCNTCRICRSINEGRFLDLIEIDAASNTGVDDVRDLREKIGFLPNEARYKVYIVDEVHMLSTAAFNALLKTLEEPPPHAIFILATTEAHKIPATVISRCQRFEFRRIPLDRIKIRLRELLEREGKSAEPEALDLIARQATGALRDAESLLDQLLSSQTGSVTLAQAQAVLGTASNETVFQLVDGWVENDYAAGLDAIHHSAEAGSDPKQFSRQVVNYLRGMLLYKTSGLMPTDIPENLTDDLKRQANALSLVELTRGIRRFSDAIVEGKSGWQPQLPLEMAFIESVGDRLMIEPIKDVRDSTLYQSTEATKPQLQDGGRPSGDWRTEKGKPKEEKARPPEPVGKERRVEETGTAPIQEPVKATISGPAPSGAPVNAGQVRERWHAVMAAIKSSDHRVEALLRSCQGVLDVEGTVVLLGFKYAFHREKIESDDWRRKVEAGLSEVMGTPLRIRCVDPESISIDKPKPDNATLDAEELKRFAMQELNAEIVEKK